LISRRLYTAGLPDPDLIIRTAGEMRLSNFLLWQAAYAEYYSTPVYWPDFDDVELQRALDAFDQRERRFGRVPEVGQEVVVPDLARSTRRGHVRTPAPHPAPGRSLAAPHPVHAAAGAPRSLDPGGDPAAGPAAVAGAVPVA